MQEARLDAYIGSRGISDWASVYSRSSATLISEYPSPSLANQGQIRRKPKKYVDIVYQTWFCLLSGHPCLGGETRKTRCEDGPDSETFV